MTIFRAMLGQLGLDADGAARVLDQSSITVRRKMQGARNATDDDVRRLRDYWWQVQSGDIDKLPNGVREAAMARKVLRGVCGITGPGKRIYEEEEAA